jgi:hypothetical protein
VARTNPSIGRSSGGRTLLNILIGVLAVIGALAIVGWAVKAVFWLIQLAVLVLVAAVVLALVKMAVRSKRDPR